MDEKFVAREFTLPQRLVSMVKGITEKTRLNESWVFAVLVQAGLKKVWPQAKGQQVIFDIDSGRKTAESFSRLGVCISQGLFAEIRHAARFAHLNLDDGELNLDESVARLLVIAFTDREGEFRELLDGEDVLRLYLANQDLAIKTKDQYK